MEKIELYKKIASQIEEKLGANHISTMIHLPDKSKPESMIEDLPQFLIVVKKFDKFTLMMITNILLEYSEELEIPYVVEYKDVQGMLDSIPRSFLEIKKNYKLLAGDDIIEMVKPPSYEHFRAQSELNLRNDILKLRRDLIRVMSHKMNTQEHIKEISIVALNSIRNYYQIIEPTLQTTEDLIEKFNQDFPNGKDSLQKVLEYTYRTIKGMEITEEDQLQLILSAFDNVLQPLLIEIDALGIEFDKTLSKGTGKLSFEEFMETYGTELNRLQEAMYEEFEQSAKKQEHVVRGELELKFRKREQNIVKRYEEELETMKKEYESQYNELKNSFDEQLEQQTEEFINKKLEEERAKLENDYAEKVKGIREELEFRYITTDLQDKEEKLRREFNEYEKKLRENYGNLEKTLRHDLEVKENNFKDALELEYKVKLEDEKEVIRRDFEDELEDALERNLKKQQRQLETEMRRRENALEQTLKKEFKRREKELLQQFRKELKLQENELKTRLLLNFERERGKRETKKSDDLMKLMEKEMALRYKEIEKIQLDLLKVLQTERPIIDFQRPMGQTGVVRNFIRPPESDESGEESDLFSKILRDNRSLSRGVRKKGVKKVS